MNIYIEARCTRHKTRRYSGPQINEYGGLLLVLLAQVRHTETKSHHLSIVVFVRLSDSNCSIASISERAVIASTKPPKITEYASQIVIITEIMDSLLLYGKE